MSDIEYDDEEDGGDYPVDDDEEEYEYEEEDVVMTQDDMDENEDKADCKYFNNKFDFLLPDASIAQSNMKTSAGDEEEPDPFGLTTENLEHKKRKVGNSDTSLSNKRQWWDNAEYLAIFQVLKYIVKNCHSFRISVDWEHLDENRYRQPLFTVTSNKSIEIMYMFNISFQSTTQGFYPEVPPKIIPHFFMPAPLYFFTLHFPLLMMKNWNPCQDMVGVIEILCRLWDEVLGSSAKYASGMYAGALLDGSISTFPETPRQLQEFVGASNEDCSFEILLSLWFGTYQNECNYDFGDLHTILDRLATAGDDNGSSSSNSGENKTVSSLSSIRNILAACPKQVPQANKVAAHSGTGYSTGTAKGHTIERPLRLRVLDKIANKIESFTSTESIQSFSVSQVKRIVTWLFDSPLLYLISYELSQMSTGDALHHANDIICYFILVNLIDRMVHQLLTLQGSTDISAIVNPSQRQLLFNIFCIAKIRWIDAEMLDACEDEAETLPSTTSVAASSTYKSPVQCKAVDVAPKKPIDKKALEEFKSRLPNWCSPSDLTTQTGYGTEIPTRFLKGSNEKAIEKVFYIEGLEQHSIFKGELNKGQKCPKFFLRELKTLNDSLSDNIRVYASESSPNILKVVMFIENDECPYFGGSYLFDVFIPSNYPDVNPQVKFLTTGRGTVRFNPNLYNCGKVCLSLLGTWQGEPWDPKTSNLTQVLNSILFLIFTKDPYFNEPGYARNAAMNQASKTYDAEVLLNSIEFAMADYFKSENVTGSTQILQDIREYYINHWSNLEPIISQMLKACIDGNMLKRDHKKPLKDLELITNWVAKNKK